MKNSLFLLCFVSGYAFVYCQMQSYQYAREIQGIEEEWHKIKVPENIFGNLNQDLSDIRIFGLTEDQDTIEAPYILRIKSDQKEKKNISFKKLNTTKNEKGYFFTFEIPESKIINRIWLDFKNNNFDWKIKLEGSQDQNEWFVIKDDYRIISFQNEATDYKFTEILFPSAKYRYFRVIIPGKEDPQLLKAYLSQVEIKKGSNIHYAIDNQYVVQNKKDKNTELMLVLKKPSRVGAIIIQPKETFDYYRPITIQSLSDSIKTQKGWKYNYRTLYKGWLTSIEKNEFVFPDMTLKKIKITIDNGNNEPLTFVNSKVIGYQHELVARFSKPARYFLTYGNKSAPQPMYDIRKFEKNIPNSLIELQLDKEFPIDKKTSSTTKPLFENALWLWTLMGVVILMLGGFSLKMMRQKK